MSLELDAILQEQAEKLFTLDPVSTQILDNITLNGLQTIYSLEHSLHINRGQIRRRIRGSTKFIGLEKERFITLSETEPFRESDRRYKRFYGLTFKGFLASLATHEISENYLFQVLERYLEGIVTTEIQSRLTDYIKLEIASWFQYHIENGFQLTYMKDTFGYYLKTRDLQSLMGRPEELIEPILTEESLDRSSSIIEVVDLQRLYSEVLVGLDQRKRDTRTLLDEKSILSIEGLDKFLVQWPHMMYSKYQRQSE